MKRYNWQQQLWIYINQPSFCICAVSDTLCLLCIRCYISFIVGNQRDTNVSFLLSQLNHNGQSCLSFFSLCCDKICHKNYSTKKGLLIVQEHFSSSHGMQGGKSLKQLPDSCLQVTIELNKLVTEINHNTCRLNYTCIFSQKRFLYFLFYLLIQEV